METLSDGRWRGADPVPAPDGMTVMTRAEAAEVLGVDQRVVTRYVKRGALVKYVTPRDQFGRPGRVVFDSVQVRSLAFLRAQGADTAAAAATHAEREQPRKRW